MQETRRDLFNGTSLEGWEHVGEGSFEVVDGKLRTQGGMGLLWYAGERFGDCRIHVVFRAHTASSNSGVFLRIGVPLTNPWEAVHKGYEVQILADGDPWHRTGCIYTMSAVEKPADRAPGEWNDMMIDLDGDRVRVTLNGATVTDFDPTAPLPERSSDSEPSREPRPRDGYLGLQNHDAESIVDFQIVAVEPLPGVPHSQ